jgi:hypothetical protein
MPKFYGVSLQFKNGVFKIGYEPHSVGQPIRPNIVVSEIEEEKPIQSIEPSVPTEPSTPKAHNYPSERNKYYTPLNCDHGYAYKTEQRKHLKKYRKDTLYANMARLYYELRGDWPLHLELNTIMAQLRYFEIDSSKWLSESNIDDTRKLVVNYTYKGKSEVKRYNFYSKYRAVADRLGVSRDRWAKITRVENIDPTQMPSDEVLLRHRALRPYLSKITEPA